MMKLPNGNVFLNWVFPLSFQRDIHICTVCWSIEVQLYSLPKHAAAFNFRSWKKMKNIVSKLAWIRNPQLCSDIIIFIISISCNATCLIRFCWNFCEVILVVEKDFHLLVCCLNKKNKDSQVGDFFVNCACPDFYKWIALNIRNAD